MQSRSAIEIRVNCRNVARCLAAVGSREDSESESSQNRLGLDLLEHLPELGKGYFYFGDYFKRLSTAAPPLATRKVGPCCSLFLSRPPALVEAAAPAADAAPGLLAAPRHRDRCDQRCDRRGSVAVTTVSRGGAVTLRRP